LSEIAGVMVGSTDMGNVSQVIPSLHPMVGIGDPSLNIHTAAFAAQARTASAHQAITDAAAALAMTAVDYLCDPSALAPNRLSASTDSHAGKE
jgi:metal-dependent amidase/aminoacylase/carboxypeptidase family protein